MQEKLKQHLEECYDYAADLTEGVHMVAENFIKYFNKEQTHMED